MTPRFPQCARCVLVLVFAHVLPQAAADELAFLNKLTPPQRLAQLAKVVDKNKDFKPVDRGSATLLIARYGTVDSVKATQLYCEVPARSADSYFATTILWVSADDAHVKKGDLLAILDCSHLHVQWQQQKAVIARAEAELRQCTINAERAGKRMPPGWLRDDCTAASLQRKQEQLNLHRARLSSLEGQFALCILRAPHDGVVRYPPGQAKRGRFAPGVLRLTAGMRLTEGQRLMRVCELKKMSLTVAIAEEQIGHVHAGQKAHVRIEDEDCPKRSIPALVASVSEVRRTVGFRGGNREVSYATQLDLQGDTSGLRPDMKAVVSITSDEQPRLPARAVLTDGDKKYCYIWGENGLEEREIETGLAERDFVLIDKGLNEGDLVLANPREAILRVVKALAARKP